ncbi:hypothetical protein ET495_04935 [Xylanimonas allomyrinae]|uniref:Uncharacterized protein n=1 Tax=Xylanimonas allomyrinae TaxID=2509459 RepID=A0A4P6EJH6_9MICO|nr:hypothetical protein [Xylanimonas allomyrinae]QAY62712.1 hypothetical protein ET495_04935 [Xylanimonas allomyrinae]
MTLGELWASGGVWVAALALSVGLGAVLVPWVLRRSEGEADAEATAARVLAGGTGIGLFERAGVTLSILAGFPEGVAVVVAVKGLGRVYELRERPAARERFVVGTLASVVWAGLCGLLGRAVIYLIVVGIG